MPVKPLRQKAKQHTLLVRARLSHQWKEDEPGPMVVAVHRQHEAPSPKGGGSVLHGVRARVGMVFDRDPAEPGVTEGGWRPTVEPERVPHRAEYLQALAQGDLWPADEATAAILNGYERNQGLPAVKFDPTYGGELEILTTWLKDIGSEEVAGSGNKKDPAPGTPPSVTSAPAPATSAPAPVTPPAAPAAPTKPEGKV